MKNRIDEINSEYLSLIPSLSRFFYLKFIDFQLFNLVKVKMLINGIYFLFRIFSSNFVRKIRQNVGQNQRKTADLSGCCQI